MSRRSGSIGCNVNALVTSAPGLHRSGGHGIQNRNAGDGDDADVVFLTEGLDGIGQLPGGVAGLDEFLDAGKAEELSLRILRFGQAVGGEGEAVTGLELEAGDGEYGSLEGAERQRALQGDGFAVQVRRNMARVGEGDSPVGGDAQVANALPRPGGGG